MICDNSDTAVGLRLAGVESCMADEADKVEEKLAELADDSDIGIILINETLCSRCQNVVTQFRKTHSLPLLVEIPDSESKGTGDSISAYVREAVGVKI
ncbi:MAG: V-type ATP synthase subunit F [Clostridia bacterium]|nr:V-type ATP synthase subunit F [Clostridia bacterium]